MRPVKLPRVELPAGERKVFTVSELNRQVRSLLERSFPSVWLEGEVSNFKHHSSGHMYLSLKDDKAQISSVFFSRYNSSLKFRIKDGLKVTVLGRLSLYDPRGQYQFYIEKMEPQGLGALQLALQQLKEKLAKEGLFDPEHKQAIPKFPACVGIVTSPTGAAIRDILNVVERRFRGTRVLIYPVRVQGEGAAEEISQAIREMNRMSNVDVLIVGRGGGSLEDLWAFNEEMVARAVFDSRIPVISAVGHEIDWSICDLAADVRAPTPSAAAELVVQNREEVERRVGDLTERMGQGLAYLLEARKNRFQTLISAYGFKQPASLVQQYVQRLDELVRQLQNYQKALMSDKTHRFHRLVSHLEALSPLAVLQRGYSITETEGGTVIRNAGSLKAGDVIVTRFCEGKLKSKVMSSADREGEDYGK